MSETGTPRHDRNVDLCAYLDDECGPGQRRRAESAMSQDPALARQLALWRRNDGALRAAFSPTRPAPRISEDQSASNASIAASNAANIPETAAPSPGKLTIAAAFLVGAVSAGGAFALMRIVGAQ